MKENTTVYIRELISAAFSPGFFLHVTETLKFGSTKIYTYTVSEFGYSLVSEFGYVSEFEYSLYPNSDTLGFCACRVKSFWNLHATGASRAFYTGENTGLHLSESLAKTKTKKNSVSTRGSNSGLQSASV